MIKGYDVCEKKTWNKSWIFCRYLAKVMNHTLPCRAVSVWAPQMQTLGFRSTVMLVIVICLYSILTGIVRKSFNLSSSSRANNISCSCPLLVLAVTWWFVYQTLERCSNNTYKKCYIYSQRRLMKWTIAGNDGIGSHGWSEPVKDSHHYPLFP